MVASTTGALSPRVELLRAGMRMRVMHERTPNCAAAFVMWVARSMTLRRFATRAPSAGAHADQTAAEQDHRGWLWNRGGSRFPERHLIQDGGCRESGVGIHVDAEVSSRHATKREEVREERVGSAEDAHRERAQRDRRAEVRDVRGFEMESVQRGGAGLVPNRDLVDVEDTAQIELEVTARDTAGPA